MPHMRSLVLLPLAVATMSCAGFAFGAEPATDSEVAVIGSKRVTFGELPDTVRSELDSTQARVEQQKRQLDINYRRNRQKFIETQAGDFVDQRVLANEARATGKSEQDLLAELAKSNVSETDVRGFYEGHKQQINKPYDDIKSQIQAYLTEQSGTHIKRRYFDSLRSKYQARVEVEPLRENVIATGPSRGAKTASVTMVEFADYQCPYCGQMAPILSQILKHYPKDVRLVYQQLPLKDIHPDALHASEASICAGAQGDFWEMHDALFANQSALSVDELTKSAERLKLNSTAFKACMDSPATAAEIAADVKAGEDAGITGTPGLFINGRFLDGAVPYERVAAIVDDELRRQNKPVPKSQH
jgi:protein-disulfide isomerase